MTSFDPLDQDTLTYSGAELRQAALLAVMATGSALSGRTGVRPGDPGLTTTLAGSVINVSAGTAFIFRTAQGIYRAAMTSSNSPGSVAAAHATLPRIDLVYLRVWDTDVDASGLRKADVVYLAGTANASPVAPTPGGTEIYIPLATISVPFSGGGSPTVSLTVRPVTVAPGGICPDAVTPGYYVGQYRDNGTYLERYNGSSWAPAGPQGGTDWDADIRLASTRKFIIGTDTNLYRSAANTLKTDDAFIAQTGLSVPTGVGAILRANKTVTENLTSNAALQDDDALTFACEAGATYMLSGFVKYSQNVAAGASSGIKAGFAIPAGSTFEWTSHGTALLTDATTYETVLTTGTGTRSMASNGTVSMTFAPVGTLVTVGAGTLVLRWCQIISSVNTTSVLAGSWLRLERMA